MPTQHGNCTDTTTEKHARKRRRYQRRMARFRDSGDKQRYGKAKRDAARVQRKTARQRTGRARAYAQKVAKNHDRIALEDLQPSFMARTKLAKKMHEAVLAKVKAELIAAARAYGCEVFLVDPAYTTQDCSCCGSRTKTRIPLSRRTYECAECGLVCDRDRNAARNVALRAGLNPEPMTRHESSLPCDDDACAIEARISRL